MFLTALIYTPLQTTFYDSPQIVAHSLCEQLAEVSPLSFEKGTFLGLP